MLLIGKWYKSNEISTFFKPTEQDEIRYYGVGVTLDIRYAAEINSSDFYPIKNSLNFVESSYEEMFKATTEHNAILLEKYK